MTMQGTSTAAAVSAARAFASDASRWAAVQRRDRAADGKFVYAVRTTGVFCRPSCRSRQPLRANVEFFAGPEQALRAGYRACKRCTPDGGAEDEARLVVVEACRLLSGEEAIRSEAVARAVGLSPSYFVRAFKRQTGVTPQAYRRRVLAERAKRELAGARTVTAALYDAGYGSASRFYAGAGKELGMQPRQARQGGEGQRVRYVSRRCSLGHLLIAWTERGVCDVAFADTADEAAADLRERFPSAERASRADLPRWIAQVIAAVERPQDAATDVPLDIRGTAFQQRVWQALRRIPAGETRTYGQLARELGAASAARAVGRACASNRLAVLVPCHRVVGRDGELTGYRWRAERKRALLEREARAR